MAAIEIEKQIMGFELQLRCIELTYFDLLPAPSFCGLPTDCFHAPRSNLQANGVHSSAELASKV
jgi:hypothetical protein